jgi:hypothetical protein
VFGELPARLYALGESTFGQPNTGQIREKINAEERRNNEDLRIEWEGRAGMGLAGLREESRPIDDSIPALLSELKIHRVIARVMIRSVDLNSAPAGSA